MSGIPSHDMVVESLKVRMGGIWRTAGRRLYIGSSAERTLVDSFRRLYLESKVETSWVGESTPTPPTDLWSYQEIVHDTRPELVIARATPNAAYLVTLCRLEERGDVYSWDGDGDPPADEQSRLQTIADLAREKRSVMVVLGSGDRHAHLPSELRRLGPLVTPGNYLVVEDTTSEVGPSRAGSDALRAIEAFVREDPSFVVDRNPEKFYLTFNAGGYLRRRR